MKATSGIFCALLFSAVCVQAADFYRCDLPLSHHGSHIPAKFAADGKLEFAPNVKIVEHKTTATTETFIYEDTLVADKFPVLKVHDKISVGRSQRGLPEIVVVTTELAQKGDTYVNPAEALAERHLGRSKEINFTYNDKNDCVIARIIRGKEVDFDIGVCRKLSVLLKTVDEKDLIKCSGTIKKMADAVTNFHKEMSKAGLEYKSAQMRNPYQEALVIAGKCRYDMGGTGFPDDDYSLDIPILPADKSR